jgi:hypothetical protein
MSGEMREFTDKNMMNSDKYLRMAY